MASHPNRNMFFLIAPIICGITGSILFHLKNKRHSSSSSTVTCPPDSAPPPFSFINYPETKYDVFLSFRGADIRFGFLSHLLEELSRRKIGYYVDDEKLKKGDKISPTLLGAIERSEILLVVFSKDYAESIWCLEELEKIMQCEENKKQIVVPIFYKVDPSTVRYQKGSYKDAFDKHGKRFDQQSLQKWKTALKKAANLSGFDSSKYNTEATLVKEAVQHVLRALNTKNQNDLKDFIGIQKHIQYLETRLCTESQAILTIGIWGMGGIGKTTIADILYNRLYKNYEGSHLLRVKEELEKGRSISDLKKDLLSNLLEEVVHDVTLYGNLSYVERRLRRKKVLIVLDDINDLHQLEILIGGHAWFGLGSRIITTSRDKHVFSKECDEVYPIKPLNFEEALQLFESALTKDCFVNKQERWEFSMKVVNYAKGVPLAIKVLACFLCDKNKDEWKSKLEKLEKVPDSKVQSVLELSYNALDDYEHKDIFLYLACFFRIGSKRWIKMLLDACGYHTSDGLRVLDDKALITISNEGIVSMHDLIQDMGCEIARRKSLKNPSQRNHLFDPDDICKVFTDKVGSETIESIRLSIRTLRKDLPLDPQAFARLDSLRLFSIEEHSDIGNKFRINPPEEGFESLPNELRYFNWEYYPLKSFPLRFCVNKLVELRFRFSKLQRLWEGVQDLPSLKVFDLACSMELIELPDLSKAPNLEVVNLESCSRLSHVSFWPNHNMVELNSIERQEHKKACHRSQVFSTLSMEESGEDSHLDLCGASLPIKSSFRHYLFPSLQSLNLTACFRLIELPEDIGFCLPSLRELVLWDAKVETLPASIKHLSYLASLKLSDCSLLRFIYELPPSIEYFNAEYCTSLEMLQFTSNSITLAHQKHRLDIQLLKCMKLDDHELEAVARHFKLITQGIISACVKDGYAYLTIPRSKVPECLSSYRATQDLVSSPLEMPLHSKAMGFIFYFVSLKDGEGIFDFKIKCHIELSNVGKVQIVSVDTREYIWNHMLFWYKSTLSLDIMEEVSRIKALATPDDTCVKVWFELVETKSKRCRIKEWGVYPIFISSEAQDLTGLKMISKY